jgi:hypothetical protein
MPLPDQGFDVVGKENLGYGDVPRNHCGGQKEIAHEYVKVIRFEKSLEVFPDARLAIFGNGVGASRQQVL